jgi:hypothetical protein
MISTRLLKLGPFPGAPSGPDWLEDETSEASVIRRRDAADVTLDDDGGAWFESQVSAEAFLEHVGEEQLGFSMALHCLAFGTHENLPYDSSARAAFEAIRERARELGVLNGALETVYRDAADPRMLVLLSPDDPLHAYLKGLCLFCHEAVAALSLLADQLRLLEPDWAGLRRRLDEAALWHFDALSEEIREDLQRIPLDPADPDDPLADFPLHLEELFRAASAVDEGLKRRFG